MIFEVKDGLIFNLKYVEYVTPLVLVQNGLFSFTIVFTSGKYEFIGPENLDVINVIRNSVIKKWKSMYEN